MLIWTLLFLVVAIITGVLGFAKIGVGVVGGIAKILFMLFLVLFIGSLVMGMFR